MFNKAYVHNRLHIKGKAQSSKMPELKRIKAHDWEANKLSQSFCLTQKALLKNTNSRFFSHALSLYPIQHYSFFGFSFPIAFFLSPNIRQRKDVFFLKKKVSQIWKNKKNSLLSLSETSSVWIKTCLAI